jgi:ABC-type Zn uptake system ZnuABC Zn-binding protein ZnuA
VLLALVALVAVAALSAIGALLATALIVVPAATTRLMCSRLRAWQAATVALAAAEGIAGVWLSVQTDAPPGATVAVLSGGVFAAVAAGRAVLGRRAPVVAGALLALALLGAGCGAEAGDDADGRPQVVATTTQAGDIVRAIAGDAAAVTQVLQPNSDPHDYEPRPSDVVRTAEAAVVFRSGENLDAWMDEVVEQSGGDPRVVDLGASARHTLPGEEEGDDPHWWHDPRNVAAAVPVIRDALSAADPAARETYARNARAYLARVRSLDAGIAACFAEVPAAQRKLVTDHDAFGLFARRYGIEVIGAVIPSQTTQAQASARDTARLTALIRRERVRAVFPETSVNARLARAIAGATGATARYVLYGDTLGPPGSSGATYLTMERANADAMVRGFTGGARGCAISGI